MEVLLVLVVIEGFFVLFSIWAIHSLLKHCNEGLLETRILYELSHRGCEFAELRKLDSKQDVGVALWRLKQQGLVYEYSGKPYKLDWGATVIPRMFRIKRRRKGVNNG